MDQGEEGEVQVLEEERTEGAGAMVGGGVMEERLVGTIAVVETPSSIPEVQGALVHAHRLALGLFPPARAILICPLSSLPDPPPAPSAEATPAFSRVSRRPLQGEAGSSGTPLCQQPARSSSRSQGPAPGSRQGARVRTTAPVPAPTSPTGELAAPSVATGTHHGLCPSWSHS